jgi:hypothetical protein
VAQGVGPEIKPQYHTKKRLSGWGCGSINNKLTKKEIRETISLTIASKTIKYLEINLMKETKDLFNENYKPLKTEFEVDIRK